MINKRTTHRLFYRLNDGDLRLRYRLCSNCTPVWDVTATKEAIKNYPETSICRLSKSFGLSKESIHHCLKSCSAKKWLFFCLIKFANFYNFIRPIIILSAD